MPVVHSSPHPNKDVRLREDLEDAMPGNPYPNVGEGGGEVEPGYDTHDWAPGSPAGRGLYPGSVRPTARDVDQAMASGWGQPTMSYSPRGQAPPLATGRREFQRQHSPSHRHSQRQRAFAREENMNPYPVEGPYRGASFAGRLHGHPSLGRSHSEDDEDDEDEGEWFDEQDFEDPDEEEERVFFPPKMGRDRAWDSSDEEEFERRFDDGDEDEDEDENGFDEEDEEFEEAFAAHRGHVRGGMMPRRGQPRLHRGPMRRSSPPPLETPPDSPPPLSFGMHPRGNMDPRMMRDRDIDPRMMRDRDMDPRMMRDRDMDPRMMRGRDMGPRIMRGRGMGSPMMNRGGMRNIPVRGGPPFGRGNSRRQEPGFRKRTRFVDSPSSVTSSDSRSAPGFQRLHGGFRPPSRSGGSIKRAMKWLTKPNGTPAALHPILRAGSLIRPVELAWDVSHPPSAVRAGLSPGVGVASFSEPATSPPVSFMRLLVPIPGLDGAHWMVDVWPFGTPYATANQFPPSPYSFVGSPSPFARTLPISPFPGSPWAGLGPHVRCADVLHAIYRMLRRRAVADDFWALDARRRDRVSKAFWVRCRAAGADVAARVQEDGQVAPPSLGQEEMDRQVQSGVKRIDFMEGRTRWEGLEWRDTDEWLVKLGRT